jgi:spermidine/putrescine transport system substrate-binding protein
MTHRRDGDPDTTRDDADLVSLERALIEGRLSRRQLLARAAALGLSGTAITSLVAACGGGGGSVDSEPSPLDTSLPESITLFNWSAYMSPKVIKGFEAETGVKVKQKYFVDNNDMYKRIKGGGTGYDIIVPSDSRIPQLRAEGLVQPLRLDLIPNWAGVTDPILRDSPSDPLVDGVKYSMPYMFGTAGILVRLDKIDAVSDSWEMLYDSANKGKIVMLADGANVLYPALALLGYSLNTENPTDIEEATARAIEQKPLVAAYDSADYVQRFLDGMPLVEGFDGDAVWAIQRLGLPKVKYVLPAEGFQVWCDAFAVPADAPHPYAAHLFINYVLDPKNMASCADATGYQPAVAAADAQISSLVQRAMRPTDEVLQQGTLSASVGDAQALYDAAWKKIQQA